MAERLLAKSARNYKFLNGSSNEKTIHTRRRNNSQTYNTMPAITARYGQSSFPYFTILNNISMWHAILSVAEFIMTVYDPMLQPCEQYSTPASLCQLDMHCHENKDKSSLAGGVVPTCQSLLDPGTTTSWQFIFKIFISCNCALVYHKRHPVWANALHTTLCPAASSRFNENILLRVTLRHLKHTQGWKCHYAYPHCPCFWRATNKTISMCCILMPSGKQSNKSDYKREETQNVASKTEQRHQDCPDSPVKFGENKATEEFTRRARRVPSSIASGSKQDQELCF